MLLVLGVTALLEKNQFGQLSGKKSQVFFLLMSEFLQDSYTMDSNCSLPLPEAFLKFLDDNGLDPSIYTAVDSIPRYIRLKPGCETHLPEIEAEIKCRLEKVAWMSGFYSIHSHISIADSKAYREGKIYGIDAASGAAVMALDVCAGDHILDLCAAPGAKLCMLLDLLGSSGSVTGVDIARHRLAACRTMLQKYLLGDHCRLFVADGTTFSLLPIRNHVESNSAGNKEDVYMEWKSRRTWKERKLNNKPRSSSSSHLPSDTAEPELVYYGRHSGVVGLSKEDISQAGCSGEAFELGYDKVLVDAECTHDGSFRHVKKFENWGWTSLERRVLDAKRTDTLNELQLQLLKNGFRLLRMGGSLVYSTCSLTVAQNEDIVEQFLSENSSAELQEIEAAKHWPCRSGGMSKTLRFDPSTSQTSGLFVDKFMKCSK